MFSQCNANLLLVCVYYPSAVDILCGDPCHRELFGTEGAALVLGVARAALSGLAARGLAGAGWLTETLMLMLGPKLGPSPAGGGGDTRLATTAAD